MDKKGMERKIDADTTPKPSETYSKSFQSGHMNSPQIDLQKPFPARGFKKGLDTKTPRKRDHDELIGGAPVNILGTTRCGPDECIQIGRAHV